ncbi:MAG: type II toxin-antitoxin system RatA family toxin [Gammaproteobacteria bacterium]
MARIHKQEHVPYSADEMFALVNDIEAYPDFLPWCTSTNVIEHHGDSLVASVSLAVGKIRQTFTTANQMQGNESIVMRLVEGPFKQLSGHWQFKSTGEGSCMVSLDMQFEFKNRLVKHTLGHAFHKITDSLVDAFIGRAQSVYGQR